MDNCVLGARFTTPTAKALAKALDWRFITESAKAPKEGVMLRWGSSASAHLDDRPGLTVLNKAEVVSATADRKLMMQRIHEVSLYGIPYAWPYTAHRDISFPVLLRARSARWGRDIQSFRSSTALNSAVNEAAGFNRYSYLLVQWLQWPLEVRVHIVGGHSVLMQYKARQPGLRGLLEVFQQPTPTPSGAVVIRNRLNGWNLYPWSPEFTSFLATNDLDAINQARGNMRITAKSVAMGFGADIAAVDFLVDDDGTYKVLEVNSAPGLEPYSLQKVVCGIQQLLEGYGGDDDVEEDVSESGSYELEF